MKKNRRRKPSHIRYNVEHKTTTNRLAHDGKAISHWDNKTVFVQGALANECVDYEIYQEKKDIAYAIATKIHVASKDRVEPICPHYSICGGCNLQHMSSNAQILFKEQTLLDLFEKIGRCEPKTLIPAIRGPIQHYRSKARLSVRYVKGKQSHLIGFRERNNGRYIADINTCKILHPKVGLHLQSFRTLLDQFDQQDCIAQIEIAAGDGEVALIFRNLSELTAREKVLLESFSKEFGYLIYLQPQGYDSVTRLYPKPTDKKLCYSLNEPKVHFVFEPADFTQVNAEINQQMIQQATSKLNLAKEDKLLDLFCGLGNFSLPLAERCSFVTGMEACTEMVHRAGHNAQLNSIENVQFKVRNLFNEKSLTSLELASNNKVLLDPPRSGADEVVQQLRTSSISHILYVSCNPATLARDADVLVNQGGYQLAEAGVMDMFPHTAHVESMALFTKV